MDKAYPSAVAGTPVEWSTGPGRRELTFHPDPAVTDPTDICRPSDEFPGDVDVTGATVVPWDPISWLLTVHVPGGAKTVSVTVVPEGD
ncbi:hypothetical protein GCM10023353_10540 [Tomitella cavernea]|uniref:Glycoside hydrolase family 5 C-terminal domain-containing protein n=2 Tax=Tomitella cavernea TaxID=1387982 RepID=A0ABP9CDU7_9ACTN